MMRAKVVIMLAVLLSLAVQPPDGSAQYSSTTIENIVTNPAKYDNAAVEVSGTVTLYAASKASGTGHYLLKGTSGAAIRVNTSEGSPELKKKYLVSGIVYLDPSTKMPFLSEKSRRRDDLPPEPTPPAGGDEVISAWTTFWPVAVLLLGLLGVVWFVLRRRARPTFTVETPAPAAEEEVTVEPEIVEAPAEPEGDLKTIRIAAPSAMTMRYIPGELVVLSGEDKGRSFKIAGFPTPEGSVVTLGREAVDGERAYAHIQIDERFHTVSRKQAELIWKDKKLFVKNLSETNPTQVNGVELKSGKTIQLKAGAVLRTGELEFEYRV